MTLPRFYPILDTARTADWIRTATAILLGGARILQLRHKGHWSRHHFEEAVEIVSLCRAANALPVVNDRADIAALLGAGVHVGQDDLPPTAIRPLVAGPLGFSTHNKVQLESSNAQPADYVALGPLFGTQSKINPDPEVGLDNLRRWRPLTARPLVAIGGITRSTAVDVLNAGADSVAVIGDLQCENIEQRVREWIQLLR